MKQIPQTLIAFAMGAGVATVLTAFPLLRWHQNQDRLLWLTSLDQHLRIARQLHRGNVETVQRDLDQRLPGLARSVQSFGRSETTLPALRSLVEYFKETGKPIPADLSAVLSPL